MRNYVTRNNAKKRKKNRQNDKVEIVKMLLGRLANRNRKSRRKFKERDQVA